MNFALSWVLGLFKKPEVEVTFDKAQVEPWPFPVETKPAKKKKSILKKATTRKAKPAAKTPAKKTAKKAK